MVDLQINYDQLHKLANDARTLKEHLDDSVPGLSTGISGVSSRAETIGSSKVSSALYKFHYAWEKPFKDAMDRLSDLAQLLDGVATKFFDMDSDFATKANTSLANLVVQNWQAQKDQYDLYLRTKDLTFTPSALWNQDGVLTQQDPVPLVPWDDPPADPGERPTHVDAKTEWDKLNQKNPDAPKIDFDGKSASTDSTYDDQGRITGSATTNASHEGLSYSEKTTYEYDGDSETPSRTMTTLTHADGSPETIETTYNSDGTYTTVNDYDDATDDDSDSHSSTITTPKADNSAIENDPAKTEDDKDFGYTATSTDKDGKETTIDVTDNAGRDNDTKVTTDDDGTVRKWEGDSHSDDWTQDEGPDAYTQDGDGNGVDDDDEDYDTGLGYGGA